MIRAGWPGWSGRTLVMWIRRIEGCVGAGRILRSAPGSPMEMIEAAYSTLPLEVFPVENLGVWKAQSVSAKIPGACVGCDDGGCVSRRWDRRCSLWIFLLIVRPGSVAVCSRDDIDGDSFTAEPADRRRSTEWTGSPADRVV